MGKKYFSKGNIIIKEGSTGSEMYFIVSGKVKVYKTINQDTIELGIMGPSNFFGEMSLFFQGQRCATVEAMEDSEMLVTDKENLIHMIEKYPDKAVKIINVMAQRLRDAHNIITKMHGEKESLKLMYEHI